MVEKIWNQIHLHIFRHQRTLFSCAMRDAADICYATSSVQMRCLVLSVWCGRFCERCSMTNVSNNLSGVTFLYSVCVRVCISWWKWFAHVLMCIDIFRSLVTSICAWPRVVVIWLSFAWDVFEMCLVCVCVCVFEWEDNRCEQVLFIGGYIYAVKMAAVIRFMSDHIIDIFYIFCT